MRLFLAGVTIVVALLSYAPVTATDLHLPRVIFYGDSISDEHYTLGSEWTDLAANALAWQKTDLAAAVAGSTLTSGHSCCTSLQDRIVSSGYEIAVFEIGVNDLGNISDPATYRAAWETVYSRLPSGVSVFVLDVPLTTRTLTNPWSAYAPDLATARADLTTIQRDEATRHGATIVTLDGETTVMLQDAAHLNESGVTYFAQQLTATARTHGNPSILPGARPRAASETTTATAVPASVPPSRPIVTPAAPSRLLPAVTPAPLPTRR